MPAYINGIGMISPQKTVETNGFLTEIMDYDAEYLSCIEPSNYKLYIDPIQSRRMNRLIKMGIASAKLCLEESGCTMPDAIITGTGLGSVEDTEKILGTIHLEQPFLNPTPFMQSTYNTISSQIAIQLKCHNYNSTYVHRTFSFESSLQDALLQIVEGTANDVLAGGIDEMTLNHLAITRRLGHWKTTPVNNLQLLNWNTPGSMAGEGAGYFLFSTKKQPSSYARILDVKCLYKPVNMDEIKHQITRMLAVSGLTVSNIDLLLLGLNGDNRNDLVYSDFANCIFQDAPLAYYKHLCGEYHTASAFALWLTANILKEQKIPELIRVNEKSREPVRHILIYNQYYNVNHSFILVSSV